MNVPKRIKTNDAATSNLFIFFHNHGKIKFLRNFCVKWKTFARIERIANSGQFRNSYNLQSFLFLNNSINIIIKIAIGPPGITKVP